MSIQMAHGETEGKMASQATDGHKRAEFVKRMVEGCLKPQQTREKGSYM